VQPSDRLPASFFFFFFFLWFRSPDGYCPSFPASPAQDMFPPLVLRNRYMVRFFPSFVAPNPKKPSCRRTARSNWTSFSFWVRYIPLTLWLCSSHSSLAAPHTFPHPRPSQVPGFFRRARWVTPGHEPRRRAFMSASAAASTYVAVFSTLRRAFDDTLSAFGPRPSHL